MYVCIKALMSSQHEGKRERALSVLTTHVCQPAGKLRVLQLWAQCACYYSLLITLVPVCQSKGRLLFLSERHINHFMAGETLWSWRVTLPADQHKCLLVGLSTVTQKGGRIGFLLVVENVWLNGHFLNIVMDENEHFRLHKMNPSTPDCAALRTPASYTCLDFLIKI